jgi:O-antigen/teichoic acid export membrane protein
MSYTGFAKDIGMVTVTKLIGALYAFIVLPVIAKSLGAESYGIWVQLVLTISFITPFTTLSLPNALIRFLPGQRSMDEIRDGIYSIIAVTAIISVTTGLFFLFFAPNIASILGSFDPLYIRLLALILIIESFNLVLFNVFRSFQNVKAYAFFVNFQILSEVVLITAAVLLDHKLLGAVLSMLIARSATMIAMAFLVARKIGLGMPRFLRIKEFLRFSLPIIPAGLACFMAQSSSKYIIGFSLGALFVGYFAPAYTIANAVYLFISPFCMVLPPLLADLCDNAGADQAKTYLRYSLKYFLAVAIPSAIGISLLARPLLTIFTTPEIAAQGYAIVPLLTLSMVFLGMTEIFDQILRIEKKTALAGTIWVAAAILSIGGNFLLVPVLKLTGAAIMNALTYGSIMALTWIFAFRQPLLRFTVEWGFAAKSIIASLPMFYLIPLFNPGNLNNATASILVSAIFYAIILFLLKGFNKKEIQLFTTLIRNTTSRP